MKTLTDVIEKELEDNDFCPHAGVTTPDLGYAHALEEQMAALQKHYQEAAQDGERLRTVLKDAIQTVRHTISAPSFEKRNALLFSLLETLRMALEEKS